MNTHDTPRTRPDREAATTEWAHRLDNGGASIHPTREDALQAQRDYVHLQADRSPVDDPPGPESAGIWRREVTEWEPDDTAADEAWREAVTQAARTRWAG